MALKPPPRLNAPDDSGSFLPLSGDTDDQNQPSQQPETPQKDPGALEDAQDILLITAAARKLGTKYPSAVPEVQTINDAVQKLQMKITMVQPPAQVATPPQQ